MVTPMRGTDAARPPDCRPGIRAARRAAPSAGPRGRVTAAFLAYTVTRWDACWPRSGPRVGDNTIVFYIVGGDSSCRGLSPQIAIIGAGRHPASVAEPLNIEGWAASLRQPGANHALGVGRQHANFQCGRSSGLPGRRPPAPLVVS